MLVSVAALCWFSPGRGSAQDTLRTREILRAVAGGVQKDATFLFVDAKTGKEYSSSSRVPDGVQVRLQSGYNDWRYWNGVLLIAMMRVGDVLNERGYTDFSHKDIAFCFDNYRYFEVRYRGEPKYEYPYVQRFTMEELDDCGAMGACVIEVSRHDPRPAYLTYLEEVSAYIRTKQARLQDQTLVRPYPERWTLWADDLYMSTSFLSRIGIVPGNEASLDDAALQVTKFHQYLFDEEKGLMRHCWYSDARRPGVAFWGRANGWALLAQVDLLDRLPAAHPHRPALCALLRKHITGIANYQSGGGLWHQLLDRPETFLETSCSAMFTYAVARAVNRGYIEPQFASLARRSWEGVMSRVRSDGKIEGVCAGTGVSDKLEDYEHRPTPLNDPHGIGAVLLAGSEMLLLERRGR